MPYAIRKDKQGWRAVDFKEDCLKDEIYSETQPEVSAPDQVKLEVLAQRNSLLASSDWTQVNDSPLSASKKKEWAEYRQLLRDISSQKGFPKKVAWPKEPK